MTPLPPGWRWVTLDELQADEPRAITDGPFGSNLTSAHYTASGARVVRLQNIGDGVFNDAAAYISLEHFRSLKSHEVKAGDLLVASLGDVLPKACLAPETLGPAIVKADCIRVRLSASVEPRWVLYSMQTPRARSWAQDQLHGVGRLRLGLKAIRQIPVPLPPIEEQRRIVEILDDHLSRLGAGDGYLDVVERDAEALWRTWFANHHVLRAAPRVPLGDILAEGLSNGRSVKSRDGGFPVLRLTAIKDGVIDLNEHKAGDWTEAEARPFHASVGDLLVSRGNGSLRLVGRGGLVIKDSPVVAYPDTLIRVRVHADRFVPTFLALIWNSREVRQQIESIAKTTAGIYKINQRDLRSVRLPMPPLADQLRFVQDADDLRTATRRIDSGVGAARARSKALRRSLLWAAFEGRLTSGVPTFEEVLVGVG